MSIDFSSQSGAILSDDELYRYLLWRTWDNSLPKLGYLCLNPSTADASVDDPTIRKCKGFAERGGYGGIVVTNQYAWRATKPTDLPKDQLIARGPDNDLMVKQMFEECDSVCLAWGNYNFRPFRPYSDMWLSATAACYYPTSLVCIGLNANGSPKHPLMPSYKNGLQPYPDRAWTPM